MLKIMELGNLTSAFVRWAKNHEKINYNKSTKRLVVQGKHFDDIYEPFQQSLVLTFLDQIGITICVAPMDSLNEWCVVVLSSNIPSKISVLYEHKDKNNVLTSRFLATKFGIEWYVNYLND